MNQYKRDWEGGTTPNFRTSWLWFVPRLIAHALFLPRTFDVPCSRFSTLTLFIVKPMDWFKCWRLHIIAASRVIGWLGFKRIATR